MMKKLIIISGCLFLFGCYSYDYTPEELEDIITVCSDDEGLKSLRFAPYKDEDYFIVNCENGNNYKIEFETSNKNKSVTKYFNKKNGEK